MSARLQLPHPPEETVTGNALLVTRQRAEGTPVDAETSHYYRSLAPEELESEIANMLLNIDGGLGRVHALLRDKLIIALEILRMHVPHGLWEIFLQQHKLNPHTVRQWRARGRHEAQRLREILGDGSVMHFSKKRAEPEPDGAYLELAKAGRRLAIAVLKHDLKYVRNLAHDYV